MMRQILTTALTLILLAGCSGTTVVLVPDANDKVGEVTLKTKAGSKTLSKANESTEASKLNPVPSNSAVLSDKEIHSMFGGILAREPLAPAHFEILFDMGVVEVSAENTVFLEIDKAIQERKSCDLSVIGHSDRVGDNDSNREVSVQRAKNVASILVAKRVDKKCMDIRYYGENDPAIPTADNVEERRNRRVVVEIR